VAQIKIYGRREQLGPRRRELSDAIHAALVEALELPEDKRFQRFILLEAEDFVYPADRSENYTIVEISIFEGRSEAAKRRLIRSIIARATTAAKLAPEDLEITIFETPKSHWGIRGVPADELRLDYPIDV